MKRFSRLVLYVGLLFLIARPTATAVSAEPAEPKKADYPNPERFEKAIKAFEAADRNAAPPPAGILAIGSSSMKGWHETIREDLAPLSIIPRGFGGSNMHDALHYADRIVIRYQPRAIVIYEGDNDIAQGVAAKTIRDTFLAFVHKVHARLPTTRIYFLSIKPSVRRWMLWPHMRDANQLIAQECSRDRRLTYVNVARGMLDADGQVRSDIFKKDNLHMNRKGYEIWRDILRPVLMKSELSYEPKAAEM